MSNDRKPDPQADAERKLRLALAAEARAEQAVRRRLQLGAYGCLTLITLAFLLLVLFSL